MYSSIFQVSFLFIWTRCDTKLGHENGVTLQLLLVPQSFPVNAAKCETLRFYKPTHVKYSSLVQLTNKQTHTN